MILHCVGPTVRTNTPQCDEPIVALGNIVEETKRRERMRERGKVLYSGSDRSSRHAKHVADSEVNSFHLHISREQVKLLNHFTVRIFYEQSRTFSRSDIFRARNVLHYEGNIAVTQRAHLVEWSSLMWEQERPKF